LFEMMIVKAFKDLSCLFSLNYNCEYRGMIVWMIC
jgi:hypothetical protein